MGSNLSVKITADVTDAATKFQTMKAETSALTSEFNKLARASVGGGLDAAAQQRYQQLAGDVAAAKSRLAEMSEQIKSTRQNSEGMSGVLEQMSSGMSKAFALTGIAAAADGMMMLGDAISTLGDRAIQIQTLSSVLGVTTSQLQAMQVAGEASGTSIEVLAHAGEKLTTMLTEARAGSGKQIESLLALGITISDIANKSFALNDALAVLKQRLEDSSSAEQTRLALLKELGPRSALAIQAIREYDGSEQGVASAMQRVNGLMPEQVERLKEVKTFWGEVGTSISNASAKLLIYLSDSAKAYGAAEAAMAGADQAPIAGAGPGRSTSATGEQQAVQESARAQEAAHAEVLQADMASIKEGLAAFKEGTAERLAALQRYAADAKQYYGSANVDEVRKANQEVLAAEREFNETQSRDAIAAAREQAQAIMANTSLSLSQRLDAERELWTGVLANDKVAGAQRLEAAREFSREYTEIEKQTAAQASAIERSNVTTDIQISKLAIDAKKTMLDQELAANQTSAAQKLALLRQLTAQEFALDNQALENELSALQEGTPEYARVYNEIRELKAKLVAALAKLDEQGAADAARAAREEVTARKIATNEILSAEGSLVSDVIGRRQSLRQSLAQIGAQMVQTEIANDLKAMTMELLIQDQGEAQKKAMAQGGLLFHGAIELQKMLATIRSQTAQTAATDTGNSARLASDSTAAAASKTASAAQGGPQVMADAAKAFSGTYASVSQIPYVGWILAPAAASAAFAAVAAYEGLASLDVGTNYVPRDMPAYIHEGEAIVPKAYNPAAGGGGGGDEGAGGYHEEHNYGPVHVNAFDRRGIAAMFKEAGNTRAFAAAARRYVNRGGGRR